MKHTVKYRPSSKVVAAKAPYQVNELIKEIQDTVYNVAYKYLKAEGWNTSDVADYFVADVQEVEPGVIRVEIRGELEYEQLSELCSQLDKVIAVKFDKDAYFEPVEPGIAEAFIRTNVKACSNVTASLNYVTPEMKQLKRAISKIYVDNDDQFHELVDSLLINEPINLVPETRALKRAIDSLVVDSEEEKRTLVYEVAKDLGVINSSSNVDAYSADDADDDAVDDIEREFQRIDRSGTDEDVEIAAIMYNLGTTMKEAREILPTLSEDKIKDYVDYYYLRDLPTSERVKIWNKRKITSATNSEYALFKKTYSHSREFKDKDTQSGSIRDLIDELENKDISYEIYDNKTDNGCTVFYDDDGTVTAASINELDTIVQAFDNDSYVPEAQMIEDLEYFYEVYPEAMEPILIRNGATPDKDNWLDGCNIPQAYNEALAYFESKYDNDDEYSELDTGVGSRLGWSNYIQSGIYEELDSDDYVDDWRELASKSVEDSDGFNTDYTLYTNGETYICMFGDKDLYEPDEAYADYETENEQDAWEWFNSYAGFADEEDEYDVYGSEDLEKNADSDDALWDVIDDEEFEFRGVQDVGYDNDGNIMVIFNHAISEDMIEPTAEELLIAFRQYGYPVHEWNTNGCNVFILSRGGILGSTTNASTYDDLDEELLDILHELSDMGYDIHDEADIKMGLGAGLGYDKQDQKLIMKDLRKRKIIASSVLARTKYVYIDHYNAFDNGKVLRNFQYMTEEQAQEAARQASIKDPTDAYYVHYDDVMNPGGDIVWVNGVAYRGMDVSPRGEGVAIRKGAQPVGVATASTEIKAHDFPESEDGWGTDVRGILDVPFARAENLMYEIRNTIRGAYTDCETVEDLADYIRQLASEFEETADELESL